jgi:NADH:ubiquinone oxidoreductase subunit K
MILVPALLGGLGLACMILRRTLLGFLVGSQLLMLGASAMLVIAGVSAGFPADGHVFGIFVLLGGVAQLIVGYALCIRLFYLKKKPVMEELRTLRH